MPRFAANVSTMFREWDFLDRFEAAADAGFRAVECQFPYEAAADAIAARLARTGLELILLNAPPGDFAAGDRGYLAVAGGFDALQASIATAIFYAQATGTPQIHVLSGNADPADPDTCAAYRRALRWAAEETARHGIGLLIEPLNARDNPGYFLGDYALAEALIADLAMPNLKLQFDIYHRQILHGDVLRALERLMPITGHVQIASVPGRAEPGSGELDDGRILRALDDLGYAGWVGCEYIPAAGTLAGLAWRDAFA